MPNINLAPTNWAAEQESIARRRKMAEMLQQQSMQPVERFSTNGIEAPISWTQGLAKLLQAYQGGEGQRSATEDQKALGQRYETEGQAAWAKGLRALQGAPERPQVLDPQESEQMADQGTPMPQNIPAVAPDRMGAMQAFGSHPETKPYSQAIMAGLLKGEEDYTLAEGAGRYRGKSLIAERPKVEKEKDEGTWSAPYELGGATVQKNSKTGQIRQAVNRPPQTHVYSPPAVTTAVVQDPSDPSRQLTVDARTYKGGSIGSPGVVGVSGKLGDTAKQEQKLSLGKPQAKLRVDTMIQNMDKLDTAIDELDKSPGLSNITGTLAGRTPNITNAATGAQAKLDSIKSQIFVSALQAMREASKTGGAVGNVSDREGDKLEATLSALGQAQGTADFKKQLAKARQQLSVSKELLRNAYEEQFGGVQDFQGVERRKTGGGWDAAKEERYQELKRKQNASQ